MKVLCALLAVSSFGWGDFDVEANSFENEMKGRLYNIEERLGEIKAGIERVETKVNALTPQSFSSEELDSLDVFGFGS